MTPTTTPGDSGRGFIKKILFGIALVIVMLYGSCQYHSSTKKAKAEKRGMFNSAVCRNEDGDWVNIPKGEYKDHAGDCLVGTPPPAPPSSAWQAPVEALVLEHECFTPCTVVIAWRFKIRGEGHPLRIKFTGVRDWVDYPGEGDFQAPPNMDSGDTQFVSSDPKNPHVRVQVYKRITVPRQ